MKKLLIILTIFSQSCAYITPNNIDIIANEDFKSKILEIKSQYVQIRDITATKTALFSNEEWNDLIIFNSLVKLIIEKLDKLDIDQLDIDEANYLYKLTSDSYLKVRKIISNHINEFDNETKSQLYAFDLNVLTNNAKIQSLLNNNDTNILKLVSNILIITLKIVKLTL